jgi:hypothetical protein
VLRAAGETETTQENIRDSLELDEGNHGFQLLTGRNCCSDIFLFIFVRTTYNKFSIYLFSMGFLPIGLYVASLMFDYCLILKTCPPSNVD